MEDQFSESYIEELAGKYKSGSLNAKEKADFDSWYSNFQDTEFSHRDAAHPELVKNRMYAHIIAQLNLQPRTTRLRIWPRIAVAAAAVAAITLGTWYSVNTLRTEAGPDAESAQYANDIAPGKNTATITLANGKVINLDTNKTSVIVADSVKTMTMLIAVTPRGGTYQIVLPDKSKVWLNADSKLEFPSNFSNAKQRIVKLTGEGYFEIYKDKVHPFIVQTDKQQVEVLGTHFNINSYKDEEATKTTLLEGSVSVRHADPEHSGELRSKSDLLGKNSVQYQDDVVLKPNQQATVTANNKIAVKQVDPSLAIAWKNNEFMFESQSMESIMKMVERWYDVEVIYEGNKPAEKYSGTVSRFDNVSSVLRILESSGGVHFKIEGRKIYVSN